MPEPTHDDSREIQGLRAQVERLELERDLALANAKDLQRQLDAARRHIQACVSPWPN
jgi:hypothetical protein